MIPNGKLLERRYGLISDESKEELRNEEKIEKGWAKTFMPDFIYLKRFAKTRKVTLQRNEEKILKKSKQKTLISSLV